MSREFFYTLILVCSFALHASGQKKIFEDDFKNNKKGWKLQHDSNFLVDIKNGALHIEKFEKNFVSRGCLWYNKNIPGLDTRNDFSITVYAKFLTGDDVGNWIDFQWGNRLEPVVPSKPKPLSNSLYQLNFDITGQVRFEHFNNKWNFFVKKSFKELLGENFDARKINKYEIAQKDSIVIFKINDKEVMRHFCEPIPGNSIGFQQCLKTAWEIDKIVIRQQEKKTMHLPDTIMTPTAKPSEINYASDKELKAYPNPFHQHLYVNVFLEKEENVKLYLIDMNGTTLQQHNKQLPAGVQTMRLYTDVAPGAYVLKMQLGEKVLTTTVIKQ